MTQPPDRFDMQQVRGIAYPRDITVYQNRMYVAVCVVRDGGTPEWLLSRWTYEGLVEVPPDEAEDVALELLP